MAVVSAAEALKKWHAGETKNLDEGRKICSQFKTAVNQAQKLHKERFYWQNVVSAFLLFLPNAVNFFRTGSFWFKSATAKMVEEKLSQQEIKKTEALAPEEKHLQSNP